MPSMVIDKKAMWVERAKALALYVLVLLVVASIGVLLAAKPAHAVTFSVNRTADTPDANLSNAACDVNASQRGNQCTLRAAIQESNDTSGKDLIRFNIVAGTSSLKTISPASALPTITEALTINGYTQSGASGNTLATGNNAVLTIQLNGTNAGGANGLVIQASESTIKGLVINRFKSSETGADDLTGNGIVINGSSSTANKVEGNFIGTSANGNTALGNTLYGVNISNGAANNTVGGTVNAARNVISGNELGGVQIRGQINGTEATGNEVLGNRIGTNAAGSAELGNATNGVFIFNASNNTIGGTAAGARNVISGNTEEGVRISGAGAAGNKVLGNFVGTNAAGSADLGNRSGGVRIDGASNNTVGDTESGARNIISGNESKGVLIFGSGATDNKVEGNFIGTNASGTEDLGNTSDGVFIFGDASNNTVGGTASGARNIISGNGFSNSTGVSFGNGVRIEGSGNKVEGNFIGTNADGTAALGNTADGVDITSGASNNTVGGTTSGARNVISGNGISGVLIFGAETTDNEVQGNFIGTKADGSGDLGNTGTGVVISLGASNNTVGGTQAGARNIISGNDRNGVGLASPSNEVVGNTIRNNVEDGVSVSSGSGNSILSNSIFSNGGLGIDLAPNGVTNNDTDDPDTGANNLQNFPVIDGAARSRSLERTGINGTINSNPNQSFRIQCFVADGDSSNHGEGVSPAGEDTTVQTGAGGNGSFECISGAGRAGDEVSVTATNTATGDTSEFSLNRTVISVL